MVTEASAGEKHFARGRAKMMGGMHYVVAYDISSNRRRGKVMETLKNYGTRVQYSVFECDLEEGRVKKLRGELKKLIEKRVDRVHMYRLCERCYFEGERYGKGGEVSGDVE
jgi:CRISPR-associated protein Cas2